MFHYIRTNILAMIKTEKWFTFTIILTQAISVMVALFATGMIYNFTMKEEAMEGTMLSICMRKNDGQISDVRAGEIKENILEMYDLINNRIKTIICDFEVKVDDDDTQEYTSSMLCYDGKNNKYIWGNSYDNVARDLGINSRYFTLEEQERGVRVVIAEGDYTKDEIKNGIDICGRHYEVIGNIMLNYVDKPGKGNERVHHMPLMAVPDELELGGIWIALNRVLNEEDYKELGSYLDDKYGGRIQLPEYEGITDIENVRANRTLILAGIAVLICVAVNYCIMYKVILEKRKRTMAVYRICGCTKWKGMLMYEAELLGCAAVMYGVFVYIYHHFLMPYFAGTLEYMPDFYTPGAYGVIGVIYISILAVAYMILVLNIVRKTPLTLSKEGAL